MNAQQWQEVKPILESALELNPASRKDFLDSMCRDASLRSEIESLLRAHDGADSNLLNPEPLAGPLLGIAQAAVLEVHSTLTPSAPAGHVPFAPGAVLGQRYRIVHLLGCGGMGEVYRADDLLLSQPVALKFLRPAAMASPSLLSRFRNEVRTARRVSHPNICRVHDIGETEGLTYLSMEYVDGEDLASLLRRIGKLPQDKALEIARQLCAGLAAAHAKGVIHRDLKPANIMLDGKGHVRITDFGIAGMAEQIRDLGSGTPAYMSPEQLAGKEVTPRSDIYALGIVLCELLTGKRPPLKPDADSTAVDPALVRVIERCLDPDPQLRPSALGVATALLGTDPLAAALAAGQTPSPELVASAGPIEGLRPSIAAACLLAVVVGLAVLCTLRQKYDLINQIPMENSSDVLAAKAREIAKSFGYTERPVDTILGWSYDEDYLSFANTQKNAEGRLYAPYPPAIYFWYLQRSHYSNRADLDDDLRVFKRDMVESGVLSMALDSEGHLLELHTLPAPETLAAQPPSFDWNRLFAAAGLEASRFEDTHADLPPISPFDARAAWTGPSPGGQSLRVEAAAYQGRPVSFSVQGPWRRNRPSSVTYFGALSVPMFVFFVLALPAPAAWLAWRNSRSGRADRRTAFRLAIFAFVCTWVDDLAGLHHVPTSTEFVVLFHALQYALAVALGFWALYMAFEPQVRKRWPASIISWSRLLAGRFRDPLVGGHLLVGVTLGVLCANAMGAFGRLPFLMAFAPKLPWAGAAPFLSLWFVSAIFGVGGGLSYMFFLNLISMPVRRSWLAVSLFVLLVSLVLAPSYGALSPISIARPAVLLIAVAMVLTRFGVLATATLIYTRSTLDNLPLTTNWSAWYASATLLAMATILGLALYGFVITLSGQPLWRSKPL